MELLFLAALIWPFAAAAATFPLPARAHFWLAVAGAALTLPALAQQPPLPLIAPLNPFIQAGRLMLVLGLVVDRLAVRPAADGLTRAGPFIVFGVVQLALLLARPEQAVAALGMALCAAAFIAGRPSGRAHAGWEMLRLGGLGLLLVMAGMAIPGGNAGGLLLAAGLAALAGLASVGGASNGTDAGAMGAGNEAMTVRIGALLLAMRLCVPQSGINADSLPVMAIGLAGFGALTLWFAALRREAQEVEAQMGLAALAFGIGAEASGLLLLAAPCIMRGAALSRSARAASFPFLPPFAPFSGLALLLPALFVASSMLAWAVLPALVLVFRRSLQGAHWPGLLRFSRRQSTGETATWLAAWLLLLLGCAAVLLPLQGVAG